MMNFSGSYDVAGAEQSQHTFYLDTIVCNVLLLDNSCVAFKVDRHCLGQTLLDLTFDYLELLERDFFGLIFKSPKSRDKSISKWLDPTKKIRKQFGNQPPFNCSFRVKFYVPDPVCLRDELSRYQFYLQIRKDIYDGRLVVPKTTAVHLAGLILQAEFGEYNSEEHQSGYTSHFRLLPQQSVEFESLAVDWHRKLGSMVPSMAELQFINLTRTLDRFGIRTSEVTDMRDNLNFVQIGVSYSGVTAFRSNKNVYQFPWENIIKIEYKRKKFLLHLKTPVVKIITPNTTSASLSRTPSSSTLVGSQTTDFVHIYRFASNEAAKIFWQYAVGCHAFFRVREPMGHDADRLSLHGSTSGATSISATAVHAAVSRIQSGFQRYFSLTRRSSYASSSGRGPIGGVDRTFSTLLALRRSARASERSFSRSGSRRSWYRSQTTGAIDIRANSNLSMNKSAVDHEPVKMYHQAPPTDRYRKPTGQSLRSYQSMGNATTPISQEGVTSSDRYISITSSMTATSHRKSHSPTGATASMRVTEPESEKFPRNRSTKPASPPLLHGSSRRTRSSPSSSPKREERLSTRTKAPKHDSNAKDSRMHAPDSTPINADDSDTTLTDNSPDRDFDRDEASHYWSGRRKQIVSRPPMHVPSFNSRGTSATAPTTAPQKRRSQMVTNLVDLPLGAEVVYKPKPEQNKVQTSLIQSVHEHSGSHKWESQISGSMESDETIGPGFFRDPFHPGAPAADNAGDGVDVADCSDNLIRICIRPDSHGRYGFNIRGGRDFGTPVLVSRVGVNMPADLCIPRLSEGDQLISINGHTVCGRKHSEIIGLLRSVREGSNGGTLELLVKPGNYVTDELNGDSSVPDSGDAPPVLLPHRLQGGIRRSDRSIGGVRPSFPPSKRSSSVVSTLSENPLLSSMLELEQSLSDGSILTKFEQLPRHKAGLTMNASRLNANLLKNRYRDISPYDQTRVILKQGLGDYINANFIIMDFPKADISLNYIAAQGPLPCTYSDFWQMCWEQHVSVVVMLTPISERGRVKCHQYWPPLGKLIRFTASWSVRKSGSTQRIPIELQLQTSSEEVTDDFAYREFTISPVSSGGRQQQNYTKSSGTQRVIQLQYISWPDHGVPNRHEDLINFVQKVRDKRGSSHNPVVVHCSAGIGRTGVLITMETAMKLMEHGQPVRPIELVQMMRSQRALLIQTTSQFQFVCETILKVFQRDFEQNVLA